MKKIKYLVMDVDGTLTDGKIYMGNDGECFKAFSVKDGYAINCILKPRGIESVILTARNSRIVQKRCEELGIKHVFQGIHNKRDKLGTFIKENLFNECAYFGDDILDLSCMIPIKEAGGVVGCPADAISEVKSIADYVCDKKSGEGALREFVEWIVTSCEKVDVEEKVKEAIAYIESIKDKELTPGKYIVNEDFFYFVNEYDTEPLEDCKLESHKRYIDIQCLISGEEYILTRDIASLTVKSEYDEKNDVMFWKPTSNMLQILLSDGGYVVLYPRDAHMGCVQVKESCKVKKIVGKVKVD